LLAILMPKPKPTRTNEKYWLRQQCRHGKYKLDHIELGYPVPGNVCGSCLVDHPAAAILNTAQARDLRVRLDEGGNSAPVGAGY